MDNKQQTMKDLYAKAVKNGTFNCAFSLAGFEITEDVRGLRSTLKVAGERRLNSTPDKKLTGEQYCDELENALCGDVQDLLEVDMIYSFGGEDAERMKRIGMTYGEFYSYNRMINDWLYFLVDKQKTEGEFDTLFDESLDFLSEEFEKRMMEKRAA